MANPETCRHRIIASGIAEEERTSLDAEQQYRQYYYCVSCGTENPRFWQENSGRYEYEIDHNVYVYVPASRTAKATATIDIIRELIDEDKTRGMERTQTSTDPGQ